MAFAGPFVGMPFSLEGFAFFLEAIFLGLYLYGWERLSPALHLASGVVVALSGLASGIFVVAVNAWMNTPAGVDFAAPPSPAHALAVTSLDPWAAFFSPAFFAEAAHMVFAAYSSIAVAVLGIHARRLRSTPESPFHTHAARLALSLALVSVPCQILAGDRAAKQLAEHEPLKLAAADGHFETARRASLAVGGWPDAEAGRLRYALKIPAALSLLAHGDLEAEVLGLDRFPREEWPPLVPVHLAYQVMVGCGMAMLALVAFASWLLIRRRPPESDPRFLRAASFAAPLGLVALEAGWFVTELGRQPWIIHGLMRTADAVTPMPGLIAPFTLFSTLYLFLGVVVVMLLRAHVFSVRE
jgi:cytochrome d ubiquinol oxidase subunit I